MALVISWSKPAITAPITMIKTKMKCGSTVVKREQWIFFRVVRKARIPATRKTTDSIECEKIRFVRQARSTPEEASNR